jgi:hypothetical protein
VGDAQADVVEPAEVAECVTRPDLSMRLWRTRWCASGSVISGLALMCMEGVQWPVAEQGTIGTVLVVGGAEGVDLGLKDRRRRGPPSA